jgi:hypothetical protein
LYSIPFRLFAPYQRYSHSLFDYVLFVRSSPTAFSLIILFLSFYSLLTSGETYSQIFKSTFTSAKGWRSYAANTAVFAPGEGLRMMMCFGTKDFLMPRIGGAEDPMTMVRLSAND